VSFAALIIAGRYVEVSITVLVILDCSDDSAAVVDALTATGGGVTI
jgi:hypothetical protein